MITRKATRKSASAIAPAIRQLRLRVFMSSKELIALASDSRLSEIALVFVRLNHITSIIVNANHGIIALEIEPAED